MLLVILLVDLLIHWFWLLLLLLLRLLLLLLLWLGLRQMLKSQIRRRLDMRQIHAVIVVVGRFFLVVRRRGVQLPLLLLMLLWGLWLLWLLFAMMGGFMLRQLAGLIPRMLMLLLLVLLLAVRRRMEQLLELPNVPIPYLLALIGILYGRSSSSIILPHLCAVMRCDGAPIIPAAAAAASSAANSAGSKGKGHCCRGNGDCIP